MLAEHRLGDQIRYWLAECPDWDMKGLRAMATQESISAASSGDELHAVLPRAMPVDGGVPLKPRPGMPGSFELDST